ncbi:hypothetical protein M427DRAFT_38075 [Gonapodya prolifera JEL478]|uniref:Exportin-1/Importin-beta-like domain-containing protein n=1 Tax=Gonapodya prolifera (strain JEL478) TaxID=1344416 RepID=A0A138ZZP0_GONPJ|nr:hypothetical protein M427DRAFT_38075 [Gonapodya prolifera JEL478]|eukprot:KXS09977.1 hypothetical protein M427DRAFT_38075 [Gonapodya prolifera JEL478]
MTLLVSFSDASAATLPSPFVFNKLVRVVALCVGREWYPDRSWPDAFENTLAPMFMEGVSRALGQPSSPPSPPRNPGDYTLLHSSLALFRSLCEEALSSTPSNGRDPSRRQMLTEQVLSRASWILESCCKSLDAILESSGVVLDPSAHSQTPYPSPANSDKAPPSPLSSWTGATSTTPTPTTTITRWEHPSSHSATQCAQISLSITAILLAYPVPWHLVRPEYVATIGRFAQLMDGELAGGALACLEELVARVRLLAGTSEEVNFLKEVGQAVVGTVECAIIAREGGTQDVEDGNCGKIERSARVASVLRAFVGQHWHRAETSSISAPVTSPLLPNSSDSYSFQFPIEHFLDLLLRFTAQQPPVEPLAHSMDVWIALTDWLTGTACGSGGSAAGTPVSLRRSNPSSPASTIRSPTSPLLPSPTVAPPSPFSPRGELVYRPRLVSLFDILLQRVLASASSDPGALDRIDDAHPDTEDGLTEWDELISAWATVIGKIAELYPGDALSRLASAFAAVAGEWERCSTTGAVWDRRSKRLAKDLRTLATGFGRVSHLFVADFEANFAATGQLIEKFLSLLAGVAGGWKRPAEAGKL